jgi:AcrR family transcriptional regulator
MWFMSNPIPEPQIPQRQTPEGSPRERLLASAVEYLSEHGLADLSLRDLAAALGTSHRMLIYHFGSKEGLFVAVVRETERRQQVALAGLFEDSDGSLTDVTRRFWRSLRRPELAAYERLFFEIYAQALQGRTYAQPLLDNDLDSWIEVALAVREPDGLTDAEARAEARLGVAVVRGLLLDVLATGDDAGVEAAFERYLAGAIRLRSPAS